MPRKGRDAPKLKWLKCPRCQHQNYGWRGKTGDFACRTCGCVFKVEWGRKAVIDLTIKGVEG